MKRNMLGLAAAALIVVACGAGVASPTAPGPTAAGPTAASGTPAAATAAATIAPPTAAATQAGGLPVVQLGQSGLGEILVDANGMTLYGEVLEGNSGVPSCKDACLEDWPPLILSGAYTIGPGLDPTVFTTVTKAFGTQLKAGRFPLYRYSGDTAPGDTNGHGAFQGFWAAVGADGKLIAR